MKKHKHVAWVERLFAKPGELESKDAPASYKHVATESIRNECVLSMPILAFMNHLAPISRVSQKNAQPRLQGGFVSKYSFATSSEGEKELKKYVNGTVN
jgi:hypothetical protein